MKSETFKEIIREVSEELDLPYIEVRDAVKSAFLSMKEEMANVNFREIETKEEYEKVLKHTGLKGFGSFWLRKKNYLTMVKNILNYDKIKEDE